MRVEKLREGRSKDRLRERRHHPEDQFALEAFRIILEHLVGRTVRAQHLDAMTIKGVGGRCRDDPAAFTKEELCAERQLQTADVLRDAGLGRILAKGGVGERPLLVGSHEELDVAQASGHRTVHVRF